MTELIKAECQIPWDLIMATNRRVSQMPVPPAACRKIAGTYNRLLNVLYVFEHET